MGKLKEECAVFGVSVRTGEAAGITYNGLLALQHRGQEAAGIAVLHGLDIVCEKNEGLVSEVFTDSDIAALSPANLGVGHTRYSTSGGNSVTNVQPFVTEYLTGRLAAVHNGNILNADAIKAALTSRGVAFPANSDSEVLSALIAYDVVDAGSLYEGVLRAARELEGAFSLIVLSSADSLVAIRDKHGFRPLCLGQNPDGMVVASESCAVESCGFTFLRDVAPGEIVVIEDGKITHSGFYADPGTSGLCIFEYVYFARPDSVVDGLSVYEARHNMGRILAREHAVKADAVCGVPDSGIEAAYGYASESGLPLIAGFFKNRYIGRSFIFPTQTQRETAVRLKLNPLRANVEGKRIVIVDDSIVRGTTSVKIIKMLRTAGAKEVHLRISSPPFLYTCHFGTDIDDEQNLIGNRMQLEEICRHLGADSLGYISLTGLKSACAKSHRPFCAGCFSGDYGFKVTAQHKSEKLYKGTFHDNRIVNE